MFTEIFGNRSLAKVLETGRAWCPVDRWTAEVARQLPTWRPWLASKDLWFFSSNANCLEIKPFVIFFNLLCSKLPVKKEKIIQGQLAWVIKHLAFCFFPGLFFFLRCNSLLSFNVALNKCNIQGLAQIMPLFYYKIISM